MPKEITTTVYQFNELNETAKEKAIQNYCENWMSHDWWDGTYDIMKEDGKKYGFRVDDIRFSGFWSQGDGASWCGAVDLAQWVNTFNSEDKEHPLTQIFLALLDEDWIAHWVTVYFDSGRYCHENTMNVYKIHIATGKAKLKQGPLKGANVEELLRLISNTIETLHERLVEECKDFARTIYKELEDDYKAQTSEESIAESYAINDVWFDESGRIA